MNSYYAANNNTLAVYMYERVRGEGGGVGGACLDSINLAKNWPAVTVYINSPTLVPRAYYI